MGKVAFITGANQGLGFGLLQRLNELYTKEDIIYVGVRRTEEREKAIQSIINKGPKLEVLYVDVAKEDTIKSVKNTIVEKHGGIDLVISNAAARISPDIDNKDQVAQFVRTNNFGAYCMLKHFQPYLKENGVFIVVASSFGSLIHLKGHLHSLFNVETKSLEEINTIMSNYITSVKKGTATTEGWPEWINIPSKIGQVALAKIAAREEERQNANKHTSIFAVCPGLVDTDASRPFFNNMHEAQTPYEAAKHISNILQTDTTQFSGKLIQFGRELPWN
ncbi:SDR family NAD(P)-dependent oxidoreductase [Tenacibaculum amylolyticum]|uniref:SDR family NAD(P)-dependent oxidoreductase n=1 Tax=Tenacibaculum amylolyticum TaxID=104269 RepID=UPI003894CB0A